LKDPPKFTQIGIFGSKICHLATLFLYNQLFLELRIQPKRQGTGLQIALSNRVTRCVCENIAQSVAKPIFRQNSCITFTVENSRLQIWDT
jgi:hypothetical protein